MVKLNLNEVLILNHELNRLLPDESTLHANLSYKILKNLRLLAPVVESTEKIRIGIAEKFANGEAEVPAVNVEAFRQEYVTFLLENSEELNLVKIKPLEITKEENLKLNYRFWINIGVILEEED